MDFVGVFLDKDSPSPLYVQLYIRLRQHILAGDARPGEKLPGKRTAAAQLGVSVNTVNEAYQMLAAEGYVNAQARSGFVVNRLERQQVAPPGEARAGQPPVPPPDGAKPARAWRYSLLTGGIDTALFPQKTYTRILKEVLAEGPPLLERGEAAGDAELREAVADYLRGYRGARCRADEIVVGAGLEVLVGMLARLVEGPVAVENPGYQKTAHIFENNGRAVRTVPVDAYGMEPGALAKSGAAAAYITPSHQFPTGCVMPVGRRGAMLEWASAGRLVIEDDYDSEFRFDGRPLPCLQGLDENGCVVYAGTFSRSLAPGIRAAYLVLPPAMLQKWRAAYGGYACTVSRFEQHGLARLLREGHFSRSLNRMRVAYRARRNVLADALKARLSPCGASIENAHTGLYFLLRVPGLNAAKAAAAARNDGLLVRALAEYAFSQRKLPPVFGGNETDTLVIGYGGLPDGDVAGAADLLCKVVAAQLGKH